MSRRAVRTLVAVLAVTAGLAAHAPANAQTGTDLAVPVLTLDQEELFLQSQFGQRLRADIEAAAGALEAENRKIETALVAEEQALTDRRPTMEMAEFRALAEAFDQKVKGIRERQDAKGRAITRETDTSQQMFFTRVGEVLTTIMRERGAVAILDQRAVFLSSDMIDITALAIARIDEVFGDGTQGAP